jgi:hypothetical protein
VREEIFGWEGRRRWWWWWWCVVSGDETRLFVFSVRERARGRGRERERSIAERGVQGGGERWRGMVHL